MELPRPFVRLPYSFDSERLAYEVAQLESKTWMPHPGNIPGNSAIPLISLHGNDNNNFSGRMQLTRHAEHCEYVQQVMASFGEVLARSRLMRLDAGAEVPRHVDFNYHWYDRVRIHIPVTTNPDVTFYCGDESVHMRAGECWIFDSWRNHQVVNRGAKDRVHLVVDTAGSSRFWNRVKTMERYGTHRDRIDASGYVTHLDHKPGQTTAVQTERYNVAPVMAPGELEALVRELIADCDRNPDNDPAVVNEYRTLLTDLAKDWREAWLLHGYEAAGEKHYQSLLNKTAGRLHRNPRALVTQSNDVGINPIIVQRILRAALNIEQLAPSIQ